MGKKNEEVKHQDKGDKHKKKHEDKEGGFFDTVKKAAEKAVPIVEQVLPFVKIAVDKLFNKDPQKITTNPSEQETIAAIASNESSLSAITQILQNTVSGLIVAPAGLVNTDSDSKVEGIELKLPKPLRDHDHHHLTNIISKLVTTLAKVVEKSPDTQATINTKTTVAIDNSGAKPMIKLTPNEQVAAATDVAREINVEEVNTTAQVDLAGAITDLHIEDQA
ncbi:MAG: hypothetical protein EKK61_03065 [Rickettsiales bacterium]|nr:MAG: hypothetical protein EKK61_03065 [Rickettsiales bacterium]